MQPLSLATFAECSPVHVLPLAGKVYTVKDVKRHLGLIVPASDQTVPGVPAPVCCLDDSDEDETPSNKRSRDAVQIDDSDATISDNEPDRLLDYALPSSLASAIDDGEMGVPIQFDDCDTLFIEPLD